MKTQLRVSLFGENALWEELLSCLGVPYEVLHDDAVFPSDRALYLLHPVSSVQARTGARKLLREGRAVLAPEHSIRSGIPGYLSVYPAEILQKLSHGGGALKEFPFGQQTVFEETARYPKKLLRDFLWEKILHAFKRQGLFCPRKAFYPHGIRTVFSFRVDADEYHSGEFSNFFEAAKSHARAISLFISMANYDTVPQEIVRCYKAGFDVHSHAYTHFTYASYEQNRRNILKATQRLEKLGVPKIGFASPYGRWSPALQRVLEEMRFQFSSEFSFDHDDLPLYPVLNGRRSNVLQVPVHPIGLGVYMQSRRFYDAAEVQHYYERWWAKKYDSGEPCIFYDHPTQWLGVYPEFIDVLFSMAKARKNVWFANMSDFSSWWKQRAARAVHCSQGQNGFLCMETETATTHFGDLGLEIFHAHKDMKTEIKLEQGIREVPSASLHWETAPTSAGEFPIGRVYREKDPARILKNRVKKWLDWEKSTPVDEIVRESIPSVLKSTLRRVLDGKQGKK